MHFIDHRIYVHSDNKIQGVFLNLLATIPDTSGDLACKMEG